MQLYGRNTVLVMAYVTEMLEDSKYQHILQRRRFNITPVKNKLSWLF